MSDIIDQNTQKIRQELANRALCRRRLLPFVHRNVVDYEAGWVHQEICQKLEQFEKDVIDRKSPRLMLFLPPRAGKSQLASIDFPAWFLGRNPTKEIISCSYSSSLAMSFSRKVRTTLRDPKYHAVFPDTELVKDSQSTENWLTTQDGGFLASGVGTGITGRGAHCVIPYCTICTRNGIIPIQDVKVNDEVLSYDHRTNERVWTRVRAVSASLSNERIINNCGIRTTASHQLFEKGVGYVRADQMENANVGNAIKFNLPQVQQSFFDSHFRRTKNNKEGIQSQILQRKMRQRCSAQKYQPRLPNMQRKKSTPCKDVHGLFQEGRNECTHSSILHKLPKVFPQATGRDEQTFKQWPKTSFLWSGLLPRFQKIKRVYTGKNQRTTSLYTLWDTYASKILHTCLLYCFPEKCSRSSLQWSLSPIESRGEGKAKRSLRYVRTITSADGYSSYRSRCGAQRNEEHGATVQDVPQVISQDGGCSASSIKTGLRGSGKYVVDLQTESGNFLVGPEDILDSDSFFQFCILSINCLIIDDPVRNREDAESALNREKVWDWYSSTAYTRLAPGAGVLVILTRWHIDDLGGRLIKAMKQGKDQWEIVVYPAIAVHDEKYRKAGEALHPERYDLKALLSIKKSLIPRDWDALYQQNPTTEEGAILKRQYWNRWENDSPPKCTYTIQSYDTAYSKSEQADYSVITTWGLFYPDGDLSEHYVNVAGEKVKGNDFTGEEAHLILLDRVKGRWDFPHLKAKGYELHRYWLPDSTIIEAKATGLPLAHEMRRMGIPVQTFTPTKGNDKLTRVHSITDLFASGFIWAPRTEWADDLIEECHQFPAGCFTAATYIALDDNTERVIIDIKQGDRVKTPTGSCRVLFCGPTGDAERIYRVEFTDGSRLEGTKDHPVYIPAKETFVALSELQAGDKLCQWKQYSIEELTTIDTLMGNLDPYDDISMDDEMELMKHSIVGYGRTAMAQFQRGISSIIGTITSAIMKYPTLNYAQQESMVLHTAAWMPVLRQCISENGHGRIENIPSFLKQNTSARTVLRSFTHIKLIGLSSVVWSVNKLRIALGPYSVPVQYAVRALKQTGKKLNAALKNAVQFIINDTKKNGMNSDMKNSRTSGCESVTAVEKNIPHETVGPAVVPKNAVPGSIGKVVRRVVRTNRKERVYNLRVETNPVYYANGVLVHNSHDDQVDSTTQALIRFRQGGFITLQSDEDEEFVPRRRMAYY